LNLLALVCSCHRVRLLCHPGVTKKRRNEGRLSDEATENRQADSRQESREKRLFRHMLNFQVWDMGGSL
jgi:hypothetical protein